jgi:hypothetical protein
VTRGTVLIVDDDEKVSEPIGCALRARRFFIGTTSPAEAPQWADLPFDAALVLDRERARAHEAVAGLQAGGFTGALLVAGHHGAIPGTTAIPFPVLYADLEVSLLRAIPGGHLSIVAMANPYGVWLDDRVLERVLGGANTVDFKVADRLLRGHFDTVKYEEIAKVMGISLSEEPDRRRKQVPAVYQAVKRVRDKLWPLGVNVATDTMRGYRIDLLG